MSIARRNAQVIIQYSTAYPFRLPEGTMVCVYCCESYEDPVEFRKHMEDEHQDCKVRIAFAHIHEGYIKVDCTDLRCRICAEGFDDVNDVARHLKTVHKQNINLDFDLGMQPFIVEKDKLMCAICSDKSSNLRALSRHIHKHFLQCTCESCGKSYATATSLQYHIRYACPNSTKQRRCRKCKKSLNSLEDQRIHLETSKNCCQHLCHVCGERFGNWKLKQIHLERAHGTPRRTYPCPECGLVFDKPGRLRAHFKIVHTSDHFQCAHCGRKFDTKYTLNKHMVVHTGEKLFACSVCSKAFPRKSTLTQHMWIHSEVKKHECKICDKQFNQKISWKTHMKSRHPDLCDF